MDYKPQNICGTLTTLCSLQANRELMRISFQENTCTHTINITLQVSLHEMRILKILITGNSVGYFNTVLAMKF